MTTETRIYFYKRFTRVESSVASAQPLLKQAFDLGKTYVFMSFSVKHEAYENAAIRKACGVYKLSEVT